MQHGMRVLRFPGGNRVATQFTQRLCREIFTGNATRKIPEIFEHQRGHSQEPQHFLPNLRHIGHRHDEIDQCHRADQQPSKQKWPQAAQNALRYAQRVRLACQLQQGDVEADHDSNQHRKRRQFRAEIGAAADARLRHKQRHSPPQGLRQPRIEPANTRARSQQEPARPQKDARNRATSHHDHASSSHSARTFVGCQ